MRYKRLTVAKTTDAGKDRGIAFLKHPYIKGEKDDTLNKWSDVLDETRQHESR